MKAPEAEALRQEQEAFELNRAQAAQWFMLRLILAYSSLVLAIGIGAILTFIVFAADRFSPLTVAAAAAGLCVDLLGACLAVWKLVLGPGSMIPLMPVSKRH